MALTACSALASVSLAAQGLVDVGRDRRLVGPISLHFTVIAASGERKTAADRTFNKPIREWMIEKRAALQPAAARARAECAAWDAQREGLLSKIKAAAGKAKHGPASHLQALQESLAELEGRQPEPLILPALFFEDTNSASLAVDIAEGWPSASLWSDEGGLIIGSSGINDDNFMGFIGLLNRLWDALPLERRRRTTKSAIIRGRAAHSLPNDAADRFFSTFECRQRCFEGYGMDRPELDGLAGVDDRVASLSRRGRHAGA